MILIAHRGLLAGPNSDLENTPRQIDYALAGGYHAEVDVWYIDNQWFLGHDKPLHRISLKFLQQKRLWLHCKNFAALAALSARRPQLNYFWHHVDAFTLTSKGYIWAYPGQPVSDQTICVLPEWEDRGFSNIGSYSCAGICSDYITRIDNILHDRYS